MRTYFGILAVVLLAACGGGEPMRTPQPAPDLKAETGVQADAPAAVSSPAEAWEYSHVPFVGDRGGEFDPANLDALAARAMTCDGRFTARDYLNEERALKLGRATRTGSELRVGKWSMVDYGPVTINGVTTAHDEAGYYVGVLKSSDLDVVFFWGPEWTRYEVHDTKTNSAARFEELPVASPSGRWLVAFGLSDESFRGIEIAERAENGLRNPQRIETTTYPCGIEWLSDAKATFREREPHPIAGPQDPEWLVRRGVATVELVNGEWVYTPAKP